MIASRVALMSLIVLCGSTLLPLRAGAQDALPAAPEERVRGGFSFGVGQGSQGVALLGTLRGGGQRWALLLRGAHTDAFTLFGPEPSPSNSDLGLLYARRSEGPSGWVSFGAGPALARSVRRGKATTREVCAAAEWCYSVTEYAKVIGTTAALALQGEAIWSPVQAFGLGVTGFLNLNTSHSFGGIVLGFHLGSQRAARAAEPADREATR